MLDLAQLGVSMSNGLDGGLVGWRGPLEASVAAIFPLVGLTQGITALRHWTLPSAWPAYYGLGMLVLAWVITMAGHYRASRDRKEGHPNDGIATVAYGMFICFAGTVWVLFDAITELSKR